MPLQEAPSHIECRSTAGTAAAEAVMGRELLLSLFLADHWLQLLVTLLELPAHSADLVEGLMQPVHQALQKADAAMGDVCSHELQRRLQGVGLHMKGVAAEAV